MEKISSFVEKAFSRRNFLVGAGSIAAATTLAGCADDSSVPIPQPVATYTDVDILNFALNLEYLETEYYLRAATGSGLPSADAGTSAGDVTAPTGPVTTGNALYTEFLNEFAQSELAHVRAIRSTITSLGGTPISRPTIDLVTSFQALATAAGIQNASTFNPFSSWNNFILGVAMFEDIGVTAYTGTAPLLQSTDVLNAAAGIQAKEAYTGALARTLIVAGGDSTTINNASMIANAINTLATSDGSTQGGAVAPNVTSTGGTLVPANSNGLAYGRTPNQILHIAYGKSGAGLAGGGFFPNGVGGAITKTTA